MSLLIIAICITVLVLLVSWAKIHPFPAFLLVSVMAAIALGLPLHRIPASLEKGIGDVMSSLLILLSFGAMFGKIVADSGAAQKIAAVMMRISGPARIQWAMVVVGFIIGIPLFYGVGFVLMVPLIFSIVYKYRLPAVWIGLPMLSALSVTHGFLPPHPSPSALVVQFGANMGLTLLYGIILAIPSIIIAGPFFARFLKNIPSQPLRTLVADEMPEEALPGSFNSFFTALLPVLLLAVTALLPVLMPRLAKNELVLFFSSPSVVLMISLIYATISLGLKRRRTMSSVMGTYLDAAKDIAPILLIIAGSGALKQVLTDTGMSSAIALMLQDMPFHPLVLGWLIAAMIRICVGSATVAGLTTAGIILPLMTATGTDPNLMVLSVGAGSLAFSHVNDSGFWMFKEYFNLSIKNTMVSWSVMESIVAIVGLIGVLLLNLCIS
ncbi:MAG: TRAP transporter large permease subunit [Chitinophagaceae bacterium]|nr:MAG: TRAP transporter large permease subunit [Chitinophagaceae bacterium]